MGDKKTCVTCKQSFPRTTEHFRVNTRRRDGFGSYCLPCARARERAQSRRQYERHRERILARNRDWYQRNRDTHLPQRLAKCRERYPRERQRHIAKALGRYYAADPADRARRREYRRGNAEKWRVWNMSARARRLAATGKATVAQVRARVEFYGERCYLCGAPWEAIDHVIPIARGGTHWPANLRPICKPCNARKWAWKLDELATRERMGTRRGAA